jgi:hypothetical protein
VLSIKELGACDNAKRKSFLIAWTAPERAGHARKRVV